MARRDLEPFTESKTYAVLQTLRSWTASSVAFAFLDSERVLFGALAVLVVASVASVFRSDLGAGVQFLSFALLFVCLAVATERFADPDLE